MDSQWQHKNVETYTASIETETDAIQSWKCVIVN